MNNSVIFGYDKYVPYIIEQVSKYSKVEFVVYPKNRVDRLSSELVDFTEKNSIKMLELPYHKNTSDINIFIENFNGKIYDLFLSYSFSQILPKSIFTIPELGTINIHGGELPRFRGAHVLNWMLIEGENSGEVTMHYINEGVDTGDIIASKKFNISFEDTSLSLNSKIQELSQRLVSEQLPLIFQQTNERFKQKSTSNSQYKLRNESDGLFDWNMPSVRIYNLIRALVKPWPGAFFYDDNKDKVTIDFFIPLKQVEEIKTKEYYREARVLFEYLDNTVKS